MLIQILCATITVIMYCLPMYYIALYQPPFPPCLIVVVMIMYGSGLVIYFASDWHEYVLMEHRKIIENVRTKLSYQQIEQMPSLYLRNTNLWNLTIGIMTGELLMYTALVLVCMNYYPLLYLAGVLLCIWISKLSNMSRCIA